MPGTIGNCYMLTSEASPAYSTVLRTTAATLAAGISPLHDMRLARVEHLMHNRPKVHENSSGAGLETIKENQLAQSPKITSL